MLIAEDEPLARMAAVQALSAAGLDVVQACDATEALAILAEHSGVHVLVTDIVMPSGTVNGYQLTAMIAARWPQIRVLIVSGTDRPQPSELPLGVGFLAKPWTGPDLIAAVRALAAQQGNDV
ncbi:response regulator [Methylobacterium sp. NMS14P]|uniref:response regulator n=1 Tax=unclassified Methylobacterium TaxID=2615210 RepID=UPI0023587C85|nr:response regulator [Methylobacterium sp. NMS14P]WCS24192.1 response regulator [Methylobacterium sp. NMS14P]